MAERPPEKAPAQPNSSWDKVLVKFAELDARLKVLEDGLNDVHDTAKA